MMHGPEKSDLPIVPAKLANKASLPQVVGVAFWGSLGRMLIPLIASTITENHVLSSRSICKEMAPCKHFLAYVNTYKSRHRK
jgi:hypothetical protein